MGLANTHYYVHVQASKGCGFCTVKAVPCSIVPRLRNPGYTTEKDIHSKPKENFSDPKSFVANKSRLRCFVTFCRNVVKER